VEEVEWRKIPVLGSGLRPMTASYLANRGYATMGSVADALSGGVINSFSLQELGKSGTSDLREWFGWRNFDLSWCDSRL
jgi:hypothetical protein